MSLLRRRLGNKPELPVPTIWVEEYPLGPDAGWGQMGRYPAYFYHTVVGGTYVLNPSQAYIDSSDNTNSIEPDYINFVVHIEPEGYPWQISISDISGDIYLGMNDGGGYGIPDSAGEISLVNGLYNGSVRDYGWGSWGSVISVRYGWNNDHWNPGAITQGSNSDSATPNAGFRVSVVGFEEGTQQDPDDEAYVDVSICFMNWYLTCVEARHYYIYDSDFTSVQFKESSSLPSVDYNLPLTIATDVYSKHMPITSGGFGSGLDDIEGSYDSCFITTSGGTKRFVDTAPIMTQWGSYWDYRQDVYNSTLIGETDLSTNQLPYAHITDPYEYSMDVNSLIAFKIKTNMIGIGLVSKGGTSSGRRVCFMSLNTGASNARLATTHYNLFVDKENPYERSIWVVFKMHNLAGSSNAWTSPGTFLFQLGGRIPTGSSSTLYGYVNGKLCLYSAVVLKFNNIFKIPLADSLSSYNSNYFTIEFSYKGNNNNRKWPMKSAGYNNVSNNGTDNDYNWRFENPQHVSSCYYNGQGGGILTDSSSYITYYLTGSHTFYEHLPMGTDANYRYYGHIYFQRFQLIYQGTGTNYYRKIFFQIQQWGFPRVPTIAVTTKSSDGSSDATGTYTLERNGSSSYIDRDYSTNSGTTYSAISCPCSSNSYNTTGTYKGDNAKTLVTNITYTF